MAADMEELTGQAERGFVPADGHELAAIMEGFPDFSEALARHLSSLADWFDGELGDEETSSLVADMARHAGSLYEASEQAARQFAEKARFWTRD